MLIALLSDAHGNAVALGRCLREIHRHDIRMVRFLGDAVGYLPGEVEVLHLLERAGVECQQDNHEAMLTGRLPLDPERDQAYRLAAARSRLSPRAIARIRRWPTRVELDVDGRHLLLVHGSPWDELGGYVYPDSPLDDFAGLGVDAVLMGNTHRPFVAVAGETLVANVGSCGLPRDQGDLPSFGIYDTSTNDCHILRVQVDPDEVLAAAGLASAHESVVSCLQRHTAAPFGSVVVNA